MPIPTHLEREIAEGLKELQLESARQLKPTRRLAIYQALWPSLNLENDYYDNFVAATHPTISIEHRRYGYLGIVTVRHVLSIWDQSAKPVAEDPPRRMLALAEGVIEGVEDPGEVNGFYLQEFYYSLEAESHDVKYGAWRALRAAYNALGMALGAPPFYNARDLKTNGFVLLDNDAAQEAAIACSVIDDHEAGTWWEKYFRQEEWSFDLDKKLKFWEWWLTEAIPEAWEKAFS